MTTPRKTPAKPAAKRAPARRPAAAKKPADRKPAAAPKPKVVETDGGYDLTYRGLTLRIDAEAVNDYEILKLAASESMADLPVLIQKLFGEEAEAQIMDACRNPETGRVPFFGEGSVSEFIELALGGLNPQS